MRRLWVDEGGTGAVELVTGEDPREVAHVIGRIGLGRLAAAVTLDAAIEVQIVQPDPKQLHNLTRIILVRNATATGCRILALVAPGYSGLCP